MNDIKICFSTIVPIVYEIRFYNYISSILTYIESHVVEEERHIIILSISDTETNVDSLQIKADIIISDEWHQYDGYVTLKPNESIFQMGLNFLLGKNERFNPYHALNFAEYFCPAWFKPGFNLTEIQTTPEESVQQLVCLYNGLRKVHYVDNKVFSDEKEYGKHVREVELCNILMRLEFVTYFP